MAVNPYKLLRRAASLRSERLRLAGAWLLSRTGRRHVGVFLDPVLACNLRCRMCYFSDEKRRATLHGRLDKETLKTLAQTLFPRALKLQIGCGAEPTLYRKLPAVVALGKQCGVPYISITTNGQLLNRELLNELLQAGLNEVTLSLHGLTPATYEGMMTGAKFARLEETAALLKKTKRTYPKFVIRINYTMNAANTDELTLLPTLMERLPADVVQLRPVQKIGETDWQDFSLSHIEDVYDTLLIPLSQELKQKGITVLMPMPEDLQELETPPTPLAAALQELTYCNIDPQNAANATLPKMSFKRMLRLLLGGNKAKGDKGRDITKKLAYKIS